MTSHLESYLIPLNSTPESYFLELNMLSSRDKVLIKNLWEFKKMFCSKTDIRYSRQELV